MQNARIRPRPLRALALALAVVAAHAAPAAAAAPHTVQPGETLWGIALQSNLTTRALAAYNGLAEDAFVIEGTTVMMPTVDEAAAALAEVDAAAAQAEEAAVAAAPATEVPVATPAADPSGGGDASDAVMDQYEVAQQRAAETRGTATEPTPTPGKVSAEEIAAVAAEHGVNPSLASAIAWQESGFENGLVSSADARGVMQILPGTWDWIKTNLAPFELDPASAHDNVHAGTLYLRQLLDETGGDEALAAAGYYQGLASVRERGLYDDTVHYVDNVQALMHQFGR